MSLFVCDTCHAIENTATGAYWCPDLFPEPFKGKRLCSECSSPVFNDGSPNREGGKWHGQFEKRIATKALLNQMGIEHFTHSQGLLDVMAQAAADEIHAQFGEKLKYL